MNLELCTTVIGLLFLEHNKLDIMLAEVNENFPENKKKNKDAIICNLTIKLNDMLQDRIMKDDDPLIKYVTSLDYADTAYIANYFYVFLLNQEPED